MRRISLRCIRCSTVVLFHAVLVLCLAVQCTAQLNLWRPTGPIHGHLWGYLAIAVDPGNSDVVYTGTYHTSSGYQGVVFKSTSGGPPWTISGSGLDGSPILKIEIDRIYPHILYAGTYHLGHHLYKSIDAGATWYSIDPVDFGYAWAFETARSDPGSIYAVGDRLYFSRDRGETWTSRTLPNNSNANRLAVSPYDPEVILVSVCEYYDDKNCNPRLYKSDNGGVAWGQPVLDPPGDAGFGAVEFDPLLPNVIYVASDSRLYKSQDLGMTWAYQPVPGDVWELEFDPRTPTTMYAVGLYNLAKSVDGGVNWAPFTKGIQPFGPGFQYIDLSTDGHFIDAATSTGVFRAQIRDDVPSFVTVAGRVTMGGARSWRRAVVSMIDSLGAERKVLTSPFGYYTIEHVQTGVTYRMHVVSKTHRFEDRIVHVDDNLTDVNFDGERIDE